jgi:ubiquitin-like protein ATG12
MNAGNDPEPVAPKQEDAVSEIQQGKEREQLRPRSVSEGTLKEFTDHKAPSSTTTGSGKILIQLRAVGEATALKKQKFKLDGSKTVIEVQKFLKKALASDGGDKPIYLFCGSGFSPTLDQNLQDLYENFQVAGELVISYAVQEAWG